MGSSGDNLVYSIMDHTSRPSRFSFPILPGQRFLHPLAVSFFQYIDRAIGLFQERKQPLWLCRQINDQAREQIILLMTRRKHLLFNTLRNQVSNIGAI